MQRYLTKRFLQSLIVIFGITVIVFVIIHLTGDPTDLLLPPEAGPAERELFRHELGLDRPIYVQYFDFLKNIAHGDFGQSFRHQTSAFSLVIKALPATIELTIAAMSLSIVIALPIGIISAIRPRSCYDRLGMTFALLGQSIPVYWAGIMLILLFAVTLGWLPSTGRGGIEHLILPAITLGLFSTAAIARFTRSSMLDVLDTDYIRTARIKGLSEYIVVLKHALKNASIPVLTITSLQFGRMLSGAVITEMIFSWPGVGRIAVQAIYNRDFPVVQTAVFVTSVIFVGINFLVDIIYTYLDPRIKYK
ncbi:MAG: ABC transporter permease [Deltaproteobacteria bacterium]|nr:MAG: ABC transporter permease [Deltaproteobacteria bacterium]HDG97446.1 ABC transporter permease [Desulfobacterales bacterium]